MKTLLVTGAAGTVGNYVVGLAEAARYRVIATDLRAKGLSVPVRGELRPGDLTDRRFVEEVVRGCDYVIHTAALLDAGADTPDLARVNTDVVVSLYDAAAAAGVERFVHMSTAMLYREGLCPPGQGDPLTEQSEVAPRGPHGMSKHGAEAFLTGRSDSAGPSWTILRAAPLYGRRGRHFAAGLLSVGPVVRLSTPILPRPSGGPLGTMVHAEDVGRALLFLLANAEAEGEVFNVSDGDVMPLGERIAETLDAYGLRSVSTGRLPHKAMRAAGRLFSAPGAYESADTAALAAWRLVVLRHGLKAALRPRLDKEALTLLYDDLVVDARKLRALGWKPRFPSFREGWKQVLRWYQAERWVPRYG